MSEKKAKKGEKDLLDTLQRLQAEFENYKKRVERERDDFIKYACEKLMKEFLTVFDHFGTALQATDNPQEFIKGMQLIYSQFTEVLEREGLKKIETKGQQFDPRYHEALLSEPVEDDQVNHILLELQPGYLLGEKVLRPARVKVGVKKEK